MGTWDNALSQGSRGEHGQGRRRYRELPTYTSPLSGLDHRSYRHDEREHDTCGARRARVQEVVLPRGQARQCHDHRQAEGSKKLLAMTLSEGASRRLERSPAGHWVAFGIFLPVIASGASNPRPGAYSMQIAAVGCGRRCGGGSPSSSSSESARPADTTTEEDDSAAW